MCTWSGEKGHFEGELNELRSEESGHYANSEAGIFPSSFSPVSLTVLATVDILLAQPVIMDLDSPRGSLSHSSVVSPAQASRIEQAIRRYEEEIQNICRSNAQLRASIQSKPAGFSQSMSSFSQPLPQRVEPQELRLRPVTESRGRGSEESAALVRKLQLRIESLEDYIVGLEDKVRQQSMGREGNAPTIPPNNEIYALRNSVALLREENESLKDQLESLSQSYRATEQRARLSSTDQSAWQNLKADYEDTIDRLRTELKRRNEEKIQSDAELRAIESRYQQLQSEYSSVCRAKSGDTAIWQEKVTALESEANHYKTLAAQRDEENTRMVQKLRDYVKESEETQEDLKYRIQMLETRQAIAQRNGRAETDAEEKSKKERPRKLQESERKSEESMRRSGSQRKLDDSQKSPRENSRKSRDLVKKPQSEAKPTAPRPKSAKGEGDVAHYDRCTRKQSRDRQHQSP